MSLEVFGVDGQHGLQLLHGFLIFSLEEQNSPQIVLRDPVARILRNYHMKAAGGTVIVAVVAQNFCVEEVCPRQVGLQGQSFFQHCACPLHVAFLHRDAADVHPAVGIFGVNFRDFLEGGLGCF